MVDASKKPKCNRFFRRVQLVRPCPYLDLHELRMSICKLCHQQRELRNSHIVPEFLYAELYNEKNQLMGVNGRGKKGWRPLQKGVREPLFCEACEQHFNEYCEKPFRANWVASSPLPNPWLVREPYWITTDYSSFKLFHLSVLFRAGVSTLPTFSEVSLGPHQERLRQMILRRDPGEFWQYPVFGLVLVEPKTQRIFQTVTRCQRGRLLGLRCYYIAYGGVQWWFCVSSQRKFELEQIVLQGDGRMPLASIPWNDLGIMKLASTLLRAAVD